MLSAKHMVLASSYNTQDGYSNCMLLQNKWGRREGSGRRREWERRKWNVYKYLSFAFSSPFFLSSSSFPSLPLPLPLSSNSQWICSLITYTVLVKWLAGSVGSTNVWNPSRVSRLKDSSESGLSKHSGFSKSGVWVWLCSCDCHVIIVWFLRRRGCELKRILILLIRK